MISFVPVVLLLTAGVGSKQQGEAPTLPDPAIELSIEAPAAAGLWKLTVKNTGGTPLHLAADGRLLRLQVTAPGSAEPAAEPTGAPRARAASARDHKPVECVLPGGLRPPAVAPERALVLP